MASLFRSGSPDGGFTVVELMVAISLATLLGIGAVTIIGGASRATLQSATRDEVAIAAFSLLEYAEANGCGLATPSPLDRTDAAADGYSPGLAALAERCFGSLGDAFDIAYDPSDPQARDYPQICGQRGFTCDFQTQFDWPRVEGEDGWCDPAQSLPTPTVIQRVVTIAWAEGSVPQERSYATRESLNPDAPAFQDLQRGRGDAGSLGTLVVPADEGTRVTYRLGGAGDRVQEIPVTASQRGSQSCAVFPFTPTDAPPTAVSIGP